MQGTVVMLMALSGLGCHHKGFSGPVQTCYSSCYSNVSSGCYSAPVAVEYTPASYVAPSCYSECYSSCYSAAYTGCYASYAAPACAPAPRHHHGLFGLCGRKRQSCGACAGAYAPACYGGTASMYGNCYSPDAGFAIGYSIGNGACYSTTFPPNYAPAVFGTSMPIVYGSGQGTVSPQSSYSAPTPAPAVAPTSASSDPNAAAPAAAPTTEPKTPPPPAAAPPTDPTTPPPPAATPPAATPPPAAAATPTEPAAPAAPAAPVAPTAPAVPAVEKPKT